MSDYRIRRDRSSLANGVLFGQKQRSKLKPWKIGLWLLAMGFLGFVLLRLNSIQPAVLKVFGISYTATPTGLEYAQRADLAYIRGDLDGAIANYREAIKQTPNDLGILYELSHILIYRSYDNRFPDDVDQAIKLATKATDLYPDSPRGYTILCYAQEVANVFEAAQRSCKRALALGAKDADTHGYLATALVNQGLYPDAGQEVQLALQIDPNSVDANIAFAGLAEKEGKNDIALTHYQQATQTNPRLEFPWFLVGGQARVIAIKSDPSKFPTAIDAYNHILSINAKNVKAYVRLCQAYVSQGQTSLARDNCQTATLLDANYSEAWNALGDVLYRTADYENAISAFEHCATLDQKLAPGDRQTKCWYYRGLAWALSGDCTKALDVFRDLLSWVGDDKYAIEKTNQGIALCGAGASVTIPPQITPTATKRGSK